MKVVRNQTSTATDMLRPDYLYRMYSNVNLLLERIGSFGMPKVLDPLHGLNIYPVILPILLIYNGAELYII